MKEYYDLDENWGLVTKKWRIFICEMRKHFARIILIYKYFANLFLFLQIIWV